MSYRSFKHLLGETSLERKCRFIFGAGILLLVSCSFSGYGWKTEQLVIGQNTLAARRLVKPVLMEIHFKLDVGSRDASVIEELSDDLGAQDDLPHFDSHVIGPPGSGQKEAREPSDDFERAAVARFIRSASGQDAFRKTLRPVKPFTFADGSPREISLRGKTNYQYIQAIIYKQNCINCHAYKRPESGDGKYQAAKVGDYAGAVSIRLPMAQINKDIHSNRAILITAALITALLAMFASLVIVRYVIVKPVKHLRDVSDAISAGKLNVRAQIRTGDEFEDLSHAFNRMLHNLVAMQQTLREVNTDLDRKVDELAQANLALFEMNRLKSDFLATMSHELRTPLNSIIGFSELLAGNKSLNDPQRKQAANIQTSGKLLLGMINDILELAKVESGKMEIRAEDFSIRDLCEALAGVTRPAADRKEITLECRLDDAIPLMRQDPGKLKQVVLNLLSNAIKFTPEGGKVTLRAWPEGRIVVIEVADTGIGIADEDREKIFEKFRQAGASGPEGGVLTREHQGTGLGLSIVRELTKLLGGDVHLESCPGRGSTFTVRVPLQLPGNRKFEVNVADERIDLSKARRIEPRSAGPHAALTAPDFNPGQRRPPLEPARGESWGRDR